MEWLLSTMERARERFAQPGEYPLIDDEEILDEGIIYESWPWEFGHRGRPSRDALMEAALTSDHAGLPVRFTWLNLLYRLAHYPADEVASVIEDRDNAAGHREEFFGDLKTLVGLTKELGNDSDPRRIRWEISNACAVQDWGLAGSLYRRLEDQAEVDQVSKIFAMHGRHGVLSVFAHRWEMDDLGLSLWAPIPGRRSAAVLELLVGLKSLGNSEEPLFSLSSDEKSRTEDAAHHLGKAIKGNLERDLIYRFLLLRCRLALGTFRDAASDCEALLKRRREFGERHWEDFEPLIISRLYALAVEAYESDDQIDRAITVSEQWLKEFPSEPGIHECRARLYQKQGDLDTAHESLRKEVECNPPRGDNPAISMALRFGELYGAPEAQWKRFRRNSDPNETDLVRSLVRILWPTAVKLDDRNLKDWVLGCGLLLKHTPDDPSLAIFAFGRLVENELRIRIFERFRGTLAAELAPLLSSSAEKDPLTNYLKRGDRGYMSLEQMLNEIRYSNPRSASGRKFREWLGREKNIGLLNRIDLASLGELNNRTKHKREDESLLDWKDAEEMARLSRDFLDVVLSM